jgi:hypothetical protein
MFPGLASSEEDFVRKWNIRVRVLVVLVEGSNEKHLASVALQKPH